jgi:hypothetical protein
MNDQARDNDHDYAPADKCAAARRGFHAKPTPQSPSPIASIPVPLVMYPLVAGPPFSLSHSLCLSKI